MKVIRAFPPNYPALKRTFRPPRTAIYAWGDRIFNPAGIAVTPGLMAHERVHGARQQAVGVEAWWSRYIEEPRFRFEEELLAHRAEWRESAEGLDAIAARLASPMYGSLCSVTRARDLILAA